MIEQCVRCASECHFYSWSRKLEGYICVLCFDYIKIENELAVSGKLLPEKTHPTTIEHK